MCSSCLNEMGTQTFHQRRLSFKSSQDIRDEVLANHLITSSIEDQISNLDITSCIEDEISKIDLNTASPTILTVPRRSKIDYQKPIVSNKIYESLVHLINKQFGSFNLTWTNVIAIIKKVLGNDPSIGFLEVNTVIFFKH